MREGDSPTLLESEIKREETVVASGAIVDYTDTGLSNEGRGATFTLVAVQLRLQHGHVPLRDFFRFLSLCTWIPG